MPFYFSGVSVYRDGTAGCTVLRSYKTVFTVAPSVGVPRCSVNVLIPHILWGTAPCPAFHCGWPNRPVYHCASRGICLVSIFSWAFGHPHFLSHEVLTFIFCSLFNWLIFLYCTGKILHGFISYQIYDLWSFSPVTNILWAVFSLSW